MQTAWLKVACVAGGISRASTFVIVLVWNWSLRRRSPALASPPATQARLKVNLFSILSFVLYHRDNFRLIKSEKSGNVVKTVRLEFSEIRGLFDHQQKWKI